MTSPRKNILVGITVLGSFVILGWMIIRFGGTIGGFFGPEGYNVQMTVERIEGLAEGNKVRYRGSGVGRVDTIRMADDRLGFVVNLSIDDDQDLPANVTGVVRAINLISGGAAVDLELQGDTADGDLKNVETIPGTFAGASLLPPEVAGLAEQAEGLLTDIHESGLVANLNDQVTQLGNLVQDINTLVADDEVNGNVRTTIANAAEASDSFVRTAREIEEFAGRLEQIEADVQVVLADAREISGSAKEITGDVQTTVQTANTTVANANTKIDDIAKQMGTTLTTLNESLATMQNIVQKIDNGDGTAGKLINDDRAYALLVDNMRLMQGTLTTVERLVQQWEENGINIDF